MPSVNPGPASSQSGQTAAVMAPFAPSPANPFPQGTAALRLLAFKQTVSLATTGDVAVMPVINSSKFVVQSILVGNAVGGSAAAANITINAGAGVTGQNFRAAGVLAGVTGPTTVVAQTVLAAALAVLVSTPNIYVNNTVAVAGVTVDVWFYGYDMTPVSYP